MRDRERQRAHHRAARGDPGQRQEDCDFYCDPPRDDNSAESEHVVDSVLRAARSSVVFPVLRAVYSVRFDNGVLLFPIYERNYDLSSALQ